jgi:8-oxo-dGTP pyrophosphatase MutT (NUDIX family)
MQPDLAHYLASGTHLCEDSATWGNGTLPLKVAYYSVKTDPPAEYVSSVRGIIFQDDSVMVVTGPQGYYYILPGGRVEKGETLLQTLRREMLEETGWTFSAPVMVGLMHFNHLGIKPSEYRYPFPDFIWPVYKAEAGEFMPGARITDKWVVESGFQPIEQVKKLPLEKGQLMLLDAALAAR